MFTTMPARLPMRGPMQLGGIAQPMMPRMMGSYGGRVLGSYDHLKGKKRIKKGGLYKLKKGETVMSLGALAKGK